MQDPNPLPWGTQDRFQAHFIVKKDSSNNTLDYIARTILSTDGHFGSKKIKNITWITSILVFLTSKHPLLVTILGV